MSAILLTVALAASPAPRDYRALGTEPFWSVTIGVRRMVLTRLGERTVSVRTPAARPTFNGRRYVTRRITVDVTRTPCNDGMSDRRFPDTVTVHFDRKTLRGCGGVPVGSAAP